MAGGAAKGGMDLTRADKGRNRGAMTVDTFVANLAGINAAGDNNVFLDRVRMAVVMTVEISGMADKASATFATINPGITVAVGAINAGAVDAGVTGEAIVFMGFVTCNDVTGMASDAECDGGNG